MQQTNSDSGWGKIIMIGRLIQSIYICVLPICIRPLEKKKTIECVASPPPVFCGSHFKIFSTHISSEQTMLAQSLMCRTSTPNGSNKSIISWSVTDHDFSLMIPMSFHQTECSVFHFPFSQWTVRPNEFIRWNTSIDTTHWWVSESAKNRIWVRRGFVCVCNISVNRLAVWRTKKSISKWRCYDHKFDSGCFRRYHDLDIEHSWTIFIHERLRLTARNDSFTSFACWVKILWHRCNDDVATDRRK